MFEVDRPAAAQPEDDCSAFMVDAQFHGSHSILPRFGKWYTVSVEDDLRIDKDTADLASRSAVSIFYYLTVSSYQESRDHSDIDFRKPLPSPVITYVSTCDTFLIPVGNFTPLGDFFL